MLVDLGDHRYIAADSKWYIGFSHYIFRAVPGLLIHRNFLLIHKLQLARQSNLFHRLAADFCMARKVLPFSLVRTRPAHSY